MHIDEIKTPTLTELFTAQLREKILSGEMKAGDRLPPERDMAKRAGVSQSIVHQSVIHLRNVGLLEVRPRKGTFVADYLRTGTASTIKELFEHSGIPMSQETVEPIMSFRRGIEVPAVKLSCLNRTQKDLDRMEGILQGMGQEQSATEFGQAFFSFFQEAALASGNPYYPLIINTFGDIYRMFSAYSVRNGQSSIERMRLDLEEILQAIKDKDVELADRLVNLEIDRWISSFEKSYNAIRSK